MRTDLVGALLPVKDAVIVFDLPIQDKCQTNDHCRENDIIYGRFVPKCDEI